MAVEDDNSKPKDAASDPTTLIDTGGGAYVSGDVDTGGGDFIGRDLIIHYGIPAALVVVGAVAFALLAAYQGWNLFDRLHVLVDPFSVEQKRMNGDLNIALAPIGAPDAALAQTGETITRWLANRLDDELSSGDVSEATQETFKKVQIWQNNSSDVPIVPTMEPITDKDRAVFWAERLGATFLIYGNLLDADPDTDLHLAFYYADPVVTSLPDIALGHHPFGESITIDATRNPLQAQELLSESEDLEYRANALNWLMKALLKLKAGPGQPGRSPTNISRCRARIETCGVEAFGHQFGHVFLHGANGSAGSRSWYRTTRFSSNHRQA